MMTKLVGRELILIYMKNELGDCSIVHRNTFKGYLFDTRKYYIRDGKKIRKRNKNVSFEDVYFKKEFYFMAHPNTILETKVEYVKLIKKGERVPYRQYQMQHALELGKIEASTTDPILTARELDFIRFIGLTTNENSEKAFRVLMDKHSDISVAQMKLAWVKMTEYYRKSGKPFTRPIAQFDNWLEKLKEIQRRTELNIRLKPTKAQEAEQRREKIKKMSMRSDKVMSLAQIRKRIERSQSSNKKR
jgi:hypothetical protein